MIHSLTELCGHSLAGSDGDIGHVKDFYFDDQSWAIRYVVADTGNWLTGRQVLLSPHAFVRLDPEAKALRFNLTRQQIGSSPSIDSHRPVSRQYEEEYYRYYGWPFYWEGGGMWGAAPYPIVTPAVGRDNQRHHGHNQRDDVHLRSSKSVTGYEIQALDGGIGAVSGFMVDDKGWVIRDLCVEAGPWYSGKEVFIAPERIERISYEESKVFVNLTFGDIRRTAEHELVEPTAEERGTTLVRVE